MALSNKTKRYRGSKSCGRGYSRRNGGGSKGGTGRAGLGHHRKMQAIVAMKRLQASKKAINLRDIERNLTKFIKKGLIVKIRGQLRTTMKFSEKYCKVLAEGELSKKLVIAVPMSKVAQFKTA